MAFVCAFAETKAGVVDTASIKNIADRYFDMANNVQDSTQKSTYLKKACERYYMLTLQDPKDTYSYIQMGRIYTLENNKKLASNYFLSAMGIEPDNANLNYHFGNYYYTIGKYRQALELYNKAYDNGMKSNAELNLKIANTYEKLGDILKANYYYKKAYIADSKNTDIPEKIRSLESIKYKNTGYYSLQRK